MEEEHEAFSLGLSHGDPAVHFVNPIANVTIIDGNGMCFAVANFNLGSCSVLNLPTFAVGYTCVSLV